MVSIMNIRVVALKFFNAMHEKNHDALASCLGTQFQDVLPNGTVVKSKEHLLSLHTQFMADPKTGFRPRSGDNRRFEEADLEAVVESDDGSFGFYRIAAEVDRPTDFREANSSVVRLYMYLGVLIRHGEVVHIQNTLFDPSKSEPS